MRLLANRPALFVLVAAWLLTTGYPRAWSQTGLPKADSTYVKLLKKAPEARLGAIIEAVGKRGDAIDLAYLLDRVTSVGPAGWTATTQRLGLDALTEAALTRNLKPAADLDRLNQFLGLAANPEPGVQVAAIRLASTWKHASSVPSLIQLVEASQGVDTAAQCAAVDALAAIGTDPAHAAIERCATSTGVPSIQRAALVAFVRINIDAAADRTVNVIATSSLDQDLAPFLAAFLDRQGGSDKLLAALNRYPPLAPQKARLTLRAISSLGSSDQGLVAYLTRLAGIETNLQPPTPSEMSTLIAQVTTSGDPSRGERIFRRPEMNCTQCHAIGGAGGGVGPDLSAVGVSSPVDYLINSIMIPDQAIKEEYQTRVILTEDGRVVQGIVVEEDDRRVILKDAIGERRVIPTTAIEESKRGGSLMPQGLVSTLTRAEFVDLIRFLAELGRPGAYAIRPTPTIQRWRAMHDVPEAIAQSASPPLDVFRSSILAAPVSGWTPIYAWTAGDLPVQEVTKVAGGAVGVIQGELLVSTPGFVQFRFAPGHLGEVVAWLDDRAIAIGSDGTATMLLDKGTRQVTLRIDATKDHEASWPIRVEVLRAAESPAEFSVVGGR